MYRNNQQKDIDVCIYATQDQLSNNHQTTKKQTNKQQTNQQKVYVCTDEQQIISNQQTNNKGICMYE